MSNLVTLENLVGDLARMLCTLSMMKNRSSLSRNDNKKECLKKRDIGSVGIMKLAG